MSLYPSKPPTIAAEYGREFPAGYTPRALDSLTAAKARAIAALDAGASPTVAESIALNGSDAVAQVHELVANILHERDILKAVPLDIEARYSAAIQAKATLLDPVVWVARQKACGELKPVAVVLAQGK